VASGFSRTYAAQAPSSLTNQEFWKLVSDFSEPDGTFHSENLVSNEIRFQTVIPELLTRTASGRAYVGVGSEQNFTYIAATRPAIAFIVDIRRGNLDLHLLYKALFEQSADRAEFVSRMFARPQPAGLNAASTAEQIFAAYASVAPSRELYTKNLEAVYTHLTRTRGFGLSAGDREGIEYVYSAWFEAGPDIRYQLTTGSGRRGRGPGGTPTYAELMTATDTAGQARSFLATEALFRFVKDLEARNLIVPVVGNFGGPKALRAVASYLKSKGAVVSAFYASNVEQYLRQDGIWDAFCASAATFPIDAKSIVIRSERGGFQGARRGEGGAAFAVALAPMQEDLKACK
jgi:hypothetical protein